MKKKPYGAKPTNPKDIVGSTKLDPGNVPDSITMGAAMAFLEGALKYGRFNWRVAGVRASIYHAAARRHLAKWWNGQDRDKKTRVHHLDSVIACLGIIRDAELYGKLTDDRPPAPNEDAMADLIDGAGDHLLYLKDFFKAFSPHQYTIHDTRSKGQSRRKSRVGKAKRVQTHARAKRNGRARA
jgi:hypothetical protein